MKNKLFFIVSVLIVLPVIGVRSFDTAGCMLHVNQQKFNHNNLTQLSWEADVLQYSRIPAGSNDFKLRIEFNSVGFSGSAGVHYVGAMVMNLNHQFDDDTFGRHTPIPGLGLYLTSLNSDWPDSKHGVKLLANPNAFPKFGRIFENVDGLGFSAKNIYSRVDIGDPGTAPLKIKWVVTKTGTVVNPIDNLSKDLNGNWINLSGTFVIWNFKIFINSTSYNVADYYLPIEYAEFLAPGDPLTLHQEYFGSADSILGSQKTKVRYSKLIASDGNLEYNLSNWVLTWRIDDERGNLDNRFGWRIEEEGKYLVSTCGQDDDVLLAARSVGSVFDLSQPPPNSQSINFDPISDKTLGDPAFTLSAKASSNLPITYSSLSSNVQINGSVVTLIKAGQVTITANQAGDAIFKGATPVDQAFCIKPSKPIVTINGANTEMPALTSSAMVGNQWFKDGQAISDATNATLIVTTAGVYKLRANVDDCLSEFSADVPMVITGDPVQGQSGFRISPNPIVSEVRILWNNPDDFKDREIALLDMLGRRLRGKSGKMQEIIFDASGLSSGPYLIKGIEGSKIYFERIIKQ